MVRYQTYLVIYTHPKDTEAWWGMNVSHNNLSSLKCSTSLVSKPHEFRTLLNTTLHPWPWPWLTLSRGVGPGRAIGRGGGRRLGGVHVSLLLGFTDILLVPNTLVPKPVGHLQANTRTDVNAGGRGFQMKLRRWLKHTPQVLNEKEVKRPKPKESTRNCVTQKENTGPSALCFRLCSLEEVAGLPVVVSNWFEHKYEVSPTLPPAFNTMASWSWFTGCCCLL